MMTASRMESGTSVLIRFNLGRAFTSVYGLAYMIMGLVMPIAMIFLMLRSNQLAESGVASLILYVTIPAFLPLFATIGSIGVTYLFSTDRSNGVYEYLIATRRIKIRDIFVSYAVADAVIVSVILGIDVSVLYVYANMQFGGMVSGIMKMLAVFSIPVAYFSSLISDLAMLTWSSLSKTYPGVNSPGGIGTIIGVIPPMVFLLIGETSRGLNQYQLGAVFSGAVFVIFVLLLFVVIRKMSNERMIT